MIIYIAELSHTGAGRSPNTVPLAAGYLAATAKERFPKSEITIFRHADQLLEAVRSKKPDILALSVYAWSERLASFCAQRVKELSKNTLIVTGGPSVPSSESELPRFLKLNPYYDVAVHNEGENSFLRVLEGSYTGSYELPDLTDIPSPYLGGFLDKFLQEGYDPMIQSMRGCPYLCTFCVNGNPSRSKVRPFALKRVFAELDYIKKRTKSKHLLLADSNFGLMGERDVEIAGYLIKSFKENDFPSRLYIYTAKMVDEHCLKIIETLSPIAELIMSFETLDEAVKKEIKRVNLEYDKFLKHVQWAKQKKILMSTQMIFGLPLQTKNTYLKSLERLLCSGVDKIYSYNLRLLSGAVLHTQESRKKYNFKTMYRLPERTFGCYDGTVVAEAEEIVVASDSFSYDDYLKVRRYCLFLELTSGQGYFSEFIHLMIECGLPSEKLVAFLTEHKFKRYPKLAFILKEYTKRIKAELFETPQMCAEYVQKLLADGKPVPKTKLNFIYTGKIMLEPKARYELFEVVKEFIRLHTKQGKALYDYLNVLVKRVVNFNHDKPVKGFVFHKDTVSFLKKKRLHSIDDEQTIQDIYMTVSRFGLLSKKQ